MNGVKAVQSACPAAAMDSSTSVSCLVISRTAHLLNGLLASLPAARRHWGPRDELLCSWNGTSEEEALLLPASNGPAFRVASRLPYHFATNMNALAEQASGDVLILLNDDLLLDPGCLDEALQVLSSQAGIGLVGARLRTPKGLLGHAGILFTSSNLPYNRLRPERLGSLLWAGGLEPPKSGEMPAVTGALMVLRREDFLAVRLRETFHICGEDVALCLDLRRQLGLSSFYATGVGAVHAEKSTRGQAIDRRDDEQLAALVAEVRAADPSLEGLIARWASEEADVLEAMLRRSQGDLSKVQRQLSEGLNDAEGARDQMRQCHVALEEARSQLRQCQVALEGARSQLVQFQSDLEQERRQLHHCQAALEEARSQLVQHQSAREQERRQLNQCQAALEEARAQLRQCQTALEEAKAQLARSSSDLAERETRLQACLEDRQIAQQQQRRLAEEWERSVQELAGLEQDRQQLESELHILRSSRSWRLTAPFRTLRGWVCGEQPRS